MITHRFTEANNPYRLCYDMTKPTSYISNLDGNKLYGWAMIQTIPSGDFLWTMAEDYMDLDWQQETDD